MTERICELEHHFRFEAAHLLPNVPEGHKCRRLHGHSFNAWVTVRGPVDAELGWVQDFGDIKRVLAPIQDALDHHYLNEIDGLENPTSENIAIWIWHRIAPQLPQLVSIRLAETCNNACVYRGD